MQTIRDFSQIQGYENTLYVIDIDDTLIRFRELGKIWWNHIYSAYVIEYKGEHHQARWATLKTWMEKIYMYKPYPISLWSFQALQEKVKENGSELILLTARDASLRAITEQNLKDCFIDIPSDKIYFNEEKGKAIKEIVLQGGYSKVIFVDDMPKNLEDVRMELEGVCELTLYHFQE